MEQILTHDYIKQSFVKYRIFKSKINKLIKKDKFIILLKNIIDNKYIKFIEIADNIIIFKANKKFRDKENEDCTFVNCYMCKFLSKVFNKADINITPSQLLIICDIYIEDNKIIVEF